MQMARTIQIRDVPEDVHRLLRVRAAESGRSLSAYLLVELEQLAARPTMAEMLERVAKRHGGVSGEQIVEIIRETRRDREARGEP
jgi:antitoxin FitA